MEVLRRTTDEDERIAMGKKILRSQAENLWALGVIGLGPHPVVVSRKLRNVPLQGYWVGIRAGRGRIIRRLGIWRRKLKNSRERSNS